ncbi:hypothetical protein B0H12DRAFT_1328285 [Mycena haematopus]|nr:hypothetical protein B0H12DRAFT_1328285 [Mycena haematopus]
MNPSNTTSDSVGDHGGIGSKVKGAAQTLNGLGENVRGTILGGVDTVFRKDSSANDAIAAKGRQQLADGMANIERGSGKPAAPSNWQNPGNQTAAQTTDTTRTNYDGGYSGTNNSGAPAPATATATAQPPMAGNDPYLNKVNQEANRGHHTAAMNAGDQYNPYHDPTAVAQKIPAYDGPGNDQQHLARGDRPVDEPRHHRDDAISGGPAINAGQTRTDVPPQNVFATGGPAAAVGGQY